MDSTCASVESGIERSVRFVVLRHTDRGGDHFDLMIDLGVRLATWKCLTPPEASGAGGQSCTRLADHRRTYLDYEGPISGDRGRVFRHDHGLCDLLVREEHLWRLDFHGERLQGRYFLECRKVKRSKRQSESAAGRAREGPQSWLLRAQ